MTTAAATWTPFLFAEARDVQQHSRTLPAWLVWSSFYSLKRETFSSTFYMLRDLGVSKFLFAEARDVQQHLVHVLPKNRVWVVSIR